MKLEKEQIRELARAMLSTRPTEITCDEWIERVARYVELDLAGKSVPPELACVAEHLAVCRECSEEFEALKKALE